MFLYLAANHQDESKFAKQISQHFKTEHIELTANQSSVDLITKIAAQFDNPICDSSSIPSFLLYQELSKCCKVALGGDGGDELFGGYNHYSKLQYLYQIQKHVPKLLRSIPSKLTSFFPKVCLAGTFTLGLMHLSAI